MHELEREQEGERASEREKTERARAVKKKCVTRIHQREAMKNAQDNLKKFTVNVVSTHFGVQTNMVATNMHMVVAKELNCWKLEPT